MQVWVLTVRADVDCDMVVGVFTDARNAGIEGHRWVSVGGAEAFHVEPQVIRSLPRSRADIEHELGLDDLLEGEAYDRQ